MSRWMQATLEYFRRRNRVWLLSLFAAVCLLYLPFVGNPFFYEDLNFFSLGSARHFIHTDFQFDLRWLPYASLDWTAEYFSDAVPHLFHLGNTLLHLVNVILLFFLLRRLLLAVNSAASESVAVKGAWFGALIFACHPVAVYAVGYVVQRSIVLATLFALVMQLSYLQALLSGQKRWLALASLAYFMAIFSDEHSVMFPVLLMAMTLLLRAQNRLGIKVTWLSLGGFSLMGLLLIMRMQGVFGSPYATIASLMPLQVERSYAVQSLDMLTQMGLYFKYLALMLIPNPGWMSVDMRIQGLSGWSDWLGWFGAAAFIAYGVFGFRLLQRGGNKGLAGLALLSPWLLFLVEFFSHRAQQSFMLYRSYFWLPGLMLLVPLLLLKLPGRRTQYALVLVVLLLIPVAWNRLWTFADSYRLWNDAALLLSADPAKGRNQNNMPEAGAERILFNRAMALVEAQQWTDAATELKQVVRLYPQLSPARHALGMAYYNLKQYDEALVQFDAAIQQSPGFAGSYYGKGLALMSLHRLEQVPALFRKACTLSNEIDACLLADLTGGKK